MNWPVIVAVALSAFILGAVVFYAGVITGETHN